MNEIIFRRTSNIFLNSGIIGLYIYLGKTKTEYKFDYYLENDFLKVTSDNLLELLEVVYYEMGKDYYDTSGKKARDEADKYYFVKEPFSAIPFAKMYTYGLAALITNNPTATASKNGQKIKFDKLFEQDYEFAYKIAEELTKKGRKLKFFTFDENRKINKNSLDEKTGKTKENKGGESEIFINSGYTKTPKMEFEEKHFQNGDLTCYLTGESCKKLEVCVNTSPLLAGLNNFESFGESKARQISWKASYLSKFSPAMCFYMYIDGLNKIACYFFNSDNLENTYRLYKKYAYIFLDENELIDLNYNKNFRLYSFGNQRKSEDKKEEYNNEFVWQCEILFVLLYTYYRNFLFSQAIEKQEESKFRPLKLLDEVPIYLTYFRADKFGKQVSDPFRPYLFEEFNNYKFIMGLFSEMEKKGWDSKKVWNWLSSLKVIKDSDKSSQNRFKLERKLRNEILDKILKIESIIDEIKRLFYAGYNELVSGTFRYRNYKILIEFMEFYERTIKYGGNEKMNEEVQTKAIKLGSSIGMSIISVDTPLKKSERETNIKNGRKYIVSLNKSRTLHQFLSEIKRIQVKYGTIVSEDLLRHLDEENWEYVKNFCIISALNKINIELLPEKSKEGDGI